MSKKKKSTTKELLEAGTRFTLSGYDGYEFKLRVKDDTVTLHKYYAKHDLIFGTVVVRRLGENNLDYYTYDPFGKKTRGRIHYSDILEFKAEVKAPAKKKKVEIEKCPVPGVDAIGVSLNEEEGELDKELDYFAGRG